MRFGGGSPLSRNGGSRGLGFSFRHALIWLVGLGVSMLACQTPSPPPKVSWVTPVRATDFVMQGDAARRASMRLVVQGLDADERKDFPSARASYERSIQVDATNPWSYLALARYYLEQGEAQRVGPLLDQSAALFEAEGLREPRVGVHLIGLRGGAYGSLGQDTEAQLYIERAQTLAPLVWGDGQLQAGELL